MTLTGEYDDPRQSKQQSYFFLFLINTNKDNYEKLKFNFKNLFISCNLIWWPLAWFVFDEIDFILSNI